MLTQYIIAVATAGLFGFVAETTMAEWTPLLNMGAVGVVLAWFLWKDEPRKRAMERAIEQNTLTLTILLIEIERTSPQAKEQAELIKSAIHKARRGRGESEE